MLMAIVIVFNCIHLIISMKITVLVDNIANEGSGLNAEHGLSFWLQTDEGNFLVDVGATSLFAENACKMGIDIADADYLILSHAHADHVGGLSAFLNINRKAKIYLSSYVCGRNCYSTRRGIKRDISIDHNLLQQHKERFIFVEGNTEITSSVRLICEIPAIFPVPMANATLLANDEQDDFLHEIAVAIDSNVGTSILSPCTHRGILNILDAMNGCKVVNFIGGLHLLDSDEKNIFESAEDIEFLSREISNRNISLCTGHCTGKVAKDILSRELGDNFKEFYSGFTMNL